MEGRPNNTEAGKGGWLFGVGGSSCGCGAEGLIGLILLTVSLLGCYILFHLVTLVVSLFFHIVMFWGW